MKNRVLNSQKVKGQANTLPFYYPDPTLSEGKGSGNCGPFSWFGQLWARTPTWLPLNKDQI